MKQLIIFILLLIFTNQSKGQVVSVSLMHDDIEREYLLYIPSSYNGESEVPLLFNFHGFGSNAGQQMLYGDFRALADQYEFIICHPQGTPFQGIPHFNVGGFTLGSTVDDVGFTNAMIDQIALDYSINLDRVYSTGMSNGGFMSFLLACQLSDRIAAVASVTGSMTPETLMECNPTHEMPIMQIHGTTDLTVPFGGNGTWTNSIAEVMAYWNTNNGCNQEPNIENLANVNTSDGSTVEHFTYTDCNTPDLVNEHYKITGGGHTWPGTALTFPGTNLDFNASEEIWRFFSQYDINGPITALSLDNPDVKKITISPNPAVSHINVTVNVPSSHFSLTTLTGRVLKTGTLSPRNNTIEIDNLKAGTYLLVIGNSTSKVFKL